MCSGEKTLQTRPLPTRANFTHIPAHKELTHLIPSLAEAAETIYNLRLWLETA